MAVRPQAGGVLGLLLVYGIRRCYFSRCEDVLSFCRDGITIRSMPLLYRSGLGVLFAVVLQFAPAVAEVPSATQGDGLMEAPAELVFTSPESGTSREGFVAVEWSEHAGAFEYRLVDGDGVELYRGPFAKAFVSGLPDGEHLFDAAALDESGATLARTAEPYRVTVEHWSLRQAWLLFSIGLVVFLTLVVVLLRGAISAGEAALESKQLSSNRTPEANE